MSIETLKADLKANLADLAVLDASASPPDILNHLKNTLWPMIEAVVDELGEVDECMADMLSEAEDILQPETAAVFSAVIAGATAVAAALKIRISREADGPLYKVVEELEKNLKDAEGIMQEIVVDTGEDFDEAVTNHGVDDDDEEDDDDDEEGDD